MSRVMEKKYIMTGADIKAKFVLRSKYDELKTKYDSLVNNMTSRMETLGLEEEKKIVSPPRTAYQWFVIQNRASIINAHPGIPFTEMGHIITNRWVSLSKEKKQMYKQMEENDQRRYDGHGKGCTDNRSNQSNRSIAQIMYFGQPSKSKCDPPMIDVSKTGRDVLDMEATLPYDEEGEEESDEYGSIDIDVDPIY